ncbi:MAG: hypothetical protein KAR40_00660 [Candidatus Sabulitectum sp.]|nr:hypothetical protein [Candidatus Sabulitectum sp.]
MRRTLLIMVLFALVAFAGDFATGGAELTKFKGYGTFRETMFGQEGNPQGIEFKDYVWMAWIPKINDRLDLCIAAQNTTIGSATTFLDQLYLNMKLSDNFSIRGGQFKVPFGYGMTRSGGSMLFADRTLIVTGKPSGAVAGSDFGLYGGKDIGSMLTVKFAPVTVDLMLSNGTGNNTRADTTIDNQFTARLAVDPTDWLTIGGSLAMVGRPDYIVIEASGDTTEVEAWSSNGMDFFAVANYPVSSTGTLNFAGEYMMMGYPGNDVENVEHHDGARMSVMAGYDMQLEGDVILAIQPAVRYDSVDPINSWATSGDEPEDNYTAIDFCVGIELFSKYNTIQIGSRTYGFENKDVDGYTDIYTKWRMNF